MDPGLTLLLDWPLAMALGPAANHHSTVDERWLHYAVAVSPHSITTYVDGQPVPDPMIVQTPPSAQAPHDTPVPSPFLCTAGRFCFPVL